MFQPVQPLSDDFFKQNFKKKNYQPNYVQTDRETVLTKLHLQFQEENNSFTHVGAGSYYKNTNTSSTTQSKRMDLDFLIVFLSAGEFNADITINEKKKGNLYLPVTTQDNAGHEFALTPSNKEKFKQYLDPQGKLSSIIYLNTLGKYLTKCFTNDNIVSQQRPSICVVRKTVAVDYDFLPAIKTNVDGVYFVPFGSNCNSWRLSFTGPEKTLLTHYNQHCHSFKLTIKLMKYINKKEGWGMASFGIECLCIRFAFDKYWNTNIFHNLVALIYHLSECKEIKHIWSDENLKPTFLRIEPKDLSNSIMLEKYWL